ncbi:MAG TPA: MFS transporter [Acidimicrobiales bacterium]|nr:MFS transporter [Acidimicrobiales bacterium]
MVVTGRDETVGGPTPPGRVFYGWAVVAAVFTMLSVASGLGFYNLTVYLRALTTEQGFSVGGVSGATAVFFLTSGVVGLPVARLIERHDPRPTIAGGALLGGASLALLGQVTVLWQVYALYVVFGAGFSAAGLVPGITVVTRWFTRRRSVALSVASTGLSVGGIVITPLTAGLITRHGLDAVTPWLGLAFVVGIIPVTAAVVRSSPAALGLQPDGDPAPPDDGTAREIDGVPYAVARTTRFFIAVTAAYVLVMLAQVGGLAHHFNLVSERLDEGRAASAVSVVAATSVVARLVGGWLATRVPIRALTVVLMVTQGLALVLLATGQGSAALYAGSVAFGLTIGNLLMLHPLLLAEAFGVREYGRIYSVSQLVMTMGVAGGPAVVGVVHDATGGYGLALTLAAMASVAGAVVLLTGSGSVRAAST